MIVTASLSFLIILVYFLVEGSAAFVTKNENSEVDIPYIYINKGFYFGEMDFCGEDSNDRREFTVKAMEDCEILALKKNVTKTVFYLTLIRIY
jgi:CRP-like cAMP-binding protein